MEREPHNKWDDRAAGRIMLGSILFCTMVGAGIGVFFVQPLIGALAGALIGIGLGFWLVPNLLHELD